MTSQNNFTEIMNNVADIKLSALKARRKPWYGDAFYLSDSDAGKIK